MHHHEPVPSHIGLTPLLGSRRFFGYTKDIFRGSSMVEQLAVNELVPGSSPGRGAT